MSFIDFLFDFDLNWPDMRLSRLLIQLPNYMTIYMMTHMLTNVPVHLPYYLILHTICISKIHFLIFCLIVF